MAKVISITNARKNIYKISQEVTELHEEVFVYNGSSGNNMVIIGENDWKAIQETLYLNSIPGMVDSILEAHNEPVSELEKYDENEDW